MRARLLPLVLVIAALAPAAALATPPQITPTCSPAPSCDGWFTSEVHLQWIITGGDPVSGCQEVWLREDTPFDGRRYECAAQQSGPPYDPATSAVTLFRDTTAPVVMDAVPDRPPDHAGWYTRPVTFSVSGRDAGSGLDSCDRVTYDGPDNGSATVTATCRDTVGHVGSRSFPLRYDATPPDASGASAETGDRFVRLHWPVEASVSVVRTPGLGSEPSSAITAAADGLTDTRVRNGRVYRYVLTLADAAGNSASRELVAVPGPRLLSPANRAEVFGPPLLTWTPVRSARYYNVQLFRDGRKVLSAWPQKPRLQLRGTWRSQGRRQRLRPGRYRWYVWPGKGKPRARKYGERIGARSFTVAR